MARVLRRDTARAVGPGGEFLSARLGAGRRSLPVDAGGHREPMGGGRNVVDRGGPDDVSRNDSEGGRRTSRPAPESASAAIVAKAVVAVIAVVAAIVIAEITASVAHGPAQILLVTIQGRPVTIRREAIAAANVLGQPGAIRCDRRAQPVHPVVIVTDVTPVLGGRRGR